MRANQTSITLSEYVERRNGVPLGERGSLTGMLHRSLGADTFAGFWRYWNPFWGNYLGRYIKAPVRKVIPAAPAVIATFIVSGAIHDAAIFAVTRSPTFLFAPWFAVLGLTVVASRRIRLRYGFELWIIRAAINAGFVVAGFGIVMAGKTLLGIA